MNEFIKLLERKGVDFTLDGDNLTVNGWLDISGCIGITSIPDNLTVNGLFYMRGCTGITSIPDNPTINGSFDISGCTGITSIPDNLTVNGWLDISGCTGITNVAFRENCGYSSRTIFAVWINENFKIAAGCFFDTLDKFEQAVDAKYSGSAAEAYKQAGRDCVAELTVKLNKEAA